MDFLTAGQRAFDITCGDQAVARNLDLFTAAGGAGKVLLLTNQIDFPGDALRGPLAFHFIGRTNAAKLNTFELRDANGVSIISLRAADLVDAADAAALKIPAVAGPEIWKDAAQPVAARVSDLVRRLSLSEKIQEMRNGAAAIPRLGIPAYDYWSECLHGVARAGTATVFPQAIGMAATWDTSLIHDEADVIATEARAKHNDYIAKHGGDSARYYGLTFWTPNINIFRDPRWGRGQETYGEDPFLTARLGVASFAACRATIRITSRRWRARNTLPSTAGRNRRGTRSMPSRPNAIFTRRICRNSRPPCAKATLAR